MGHTLIPASRCIRHPNFAQKSLSSRQYWYAETVTALLYPSLPQVQIYPLEQISSTNLLGEGTQACCERLTAPRCLSQDSKEKAALGPVISPDHPPTPSSWRPPGLRVEGGVSNAYTLQSCKEDWTAFCSFWKDHSWPWIVF